MTERSEVNSDRRILTLPAIHPCEAISPASLLHSLTALCRRIDAFRPRRFPTHRRNARESIRQAGILLCFFDDLRSNHTDLPESVTVAFSELHVALQRILHLLHDCSRRDARLFVLMMSHRITSEFRHLTRTVATALDALPLSSIHASSPDIIEMVELLSEQAWEVPIDTDPSDTRVIKEIQSMLDQFKNGVPPAPSGLRRVLAHLQISRWSECNEEVLFMEEELFAVKDGENSETAGVLGSLIGFMAYCRATLFDSVDAGQIERRFNQQGGLVRLKSEDLRCPISLEIMKEPVTISTGHTYDRPSIEKWLKAGCQTCPVTGERLTNTDLVPNATLKKLVNDFCHQNNIPLATAGEGVSNHHKKRDLTKTLFPSSSSAAGATRMLADFLVEQISTGTTEDKNKAAYEIRLLSKSSLFTRSSLVEAGSVPWLLHLLYSADPSTQENAVAALLNLSKHPKGRAAVHESGGLALIIDVIREGIRVEAQQNAAAIMFYLSSEYRQEIGDIPEAIPTLVDLLRRGAYRGKKNAVVSLFGLQVFPPNHAKVLSAGAVPVIADLLSTERGDLVNDCVAVLAKLAERPEGANVILRSSAVPKLVQVLHSSASRSGREYCVSALLSLCVNGGEKAVRLLEKMPLLMPSLYTLVTDGSGQACKKARSVLNHIHRLHEEDYPAVLTSPVHDRIIHAQ